MGAHANARSRRKNLPHVSPLPVQNPNIELTREIAKRLRPLLPDLTFVGGCATGLLITDPERACASDA